MGVDQTGAAARGGLGAKPLPCAVARRTRAAWELRVLDGARPLTLSSFAERELAAVAGPRLGRCGILVDCVFGLPAALGPSGGSSSAIWELMGGTLREPRYGREPAERFFDRIVGEPGKAPPRRHCELQARCNSVFQKRPFQKNIQTGTFRIWLDLARSPRPWLNLWPFDEPAHSPSGRPWAFEAFPSLLWRDLLGLRSRDRSRLRRALRAAFGRTGLRVDSWELLEDDADHADAAVLALGGALLQRQGRLFEPFPGFRALLERVGAGEGWIAGLRPSSELQ